MKTLKAIDAGLGISILQQYHFHGISAEKDKLTLYVIGGPLTYDVSSDHKEILKSAGWHSEGGKWIFPLTESSRENEIRITISGPPKSGKSTLAWAIKRMLTGIVPEVPCRMIGADFRKAKPRFPDLGSVVIEEVGEMKELPSKFPNSLLDPFEDE